MANKNIPQIRFKGFDGEWGIKSLGELSIIKGRIGFRGYTRADLVSYENGAITLSPGDINDGILDFSDCTYISWDKYYESPEIMIEENDVIFCKTASIGKTAVVKNMPAKCTINPQLVVFKKIKGDHDFFGLILKTDRIQKGTIEQMGMGSIPNISQKKIESLEAKFPSSSEQTRIASLFTALDKQISCSEAKLDKLRTIKKTLLKKMFASQGEKTPQIRFKGFDGEWEEKRLGEIGVVSMCKRIFKWQTSSTGDIPFYKIGTFGQNADSFIDIKLYKEYKNLYPYPNKGDILISAAGTIGRTVVYYGEEAYFQDSNIVWLNHNEEIVSNKFLYHLYNIIQWYGIEGSTIKRLYNNNILNTKSRIPSHTEQKKLASFFTSLDKQISNQEQKIEKLKAIKKTLLKKMFV